MLKHFYVEFFHKNIKNIIIYLLLQVYIPLEKIALPHYYGNLISHIQGANFGSIKKYFCLLILIWILIQGINIIKSYVNGNIYPKFLGHIRTKLVNLIVDSNKTDYQDMKTGKLLTKLIDAPYIYYGMAKETKNLVFNNLITYVSTFAYLFYYDKFISLIYLISMSVVLYVTYIYVHNCKKYVRQSENQYVEVHEEVDDTMNNLISIYTSNKVKEEKKRLHKYSDKSVDSEKSLIYNNTTYRMYFSVIFVIIFIVLNYFSFKLFLDKKIKLNVLVSIVIINYSLLGSFMSIFYDVKDFMDNKERLNLLDEFLEEMPKPNKISRKQNTTTPEVFQKQFVKIEIKDLNFKYQKTQIFQDFNLTINRKEKIGLVGSIGSGKSTLVKLLVGLKINYNGKILINGRDVKSLNIDKMRNYITYIPQHPKLFNRTLFENITYGLEGVTEKQIYDILDSVGLDDVKDRFKKMMREKVGKNGSELSGGQRQIVWLVRSLLKDNRMIILDEPTSSLDEDNKDKVVKLIEELSKKRNIILISHDKTVLENMDRVIRLDKGKIVSDTQI